MNLFQKYLFTSYYLRYLLKFKIDRIQYVGSGINEKNTLWGRRLFLSLQKKEHQVSLFQIKK